MVCPVYSSIGGAPGKTLVISTLKHHRPDWGFTVLVPGDSVCQKSMVSTFSNTSGVVEAGIVGTVAGVFSAEMQLEPAHNKIVDIKQPAIARAFILTSQALIS
jgi:hypothetical protein